MEQSKDDTTAAQPCPSFANVVSKLLATLSTLERSTAAEVPCICVFPSDLTWPPIGKGTVFRQTARRTSCSIPSTVVLAGVPYLVLDPGRDSFTNAAVPWRC